MLLKAAKGTGKTHFPNYQDVLISSVGYMENQCYFKGIHVERYPPLEITCRRGDGTSL